MCVRTSQWKTLIGSPSQTMSRPITPRTSDAMFNLDSVVDPADTDADRVREGAIKDTDGD
jgi:hypothetical protein